MYKDVRFFSEYFILKFFLPPTQCPKKCSLLERLDSCLRSNQWAPPPPQIYLSVDRFFYITFSLNSELRNSTFKIEKGRLCLQPKSPTPAPQNTWNCVIILFWFRSFTFTSINSQLHRPISFSCFTSPETRGLSPQNPTGRPCVCWLPGAFCQGELRQSCNYRTISCIPLTNCSYCFETINPTMFSLNNTLQHTKSFVRVKPHSLFPPPTLHMFHLSVSSVGWSDFWRQQMGTRQVVPNCFRTPNPIFFLDNPFRYEKKSTI